MDLGDIDEYFTPPAKETEPISRNVELNKIKESRPTEEMLERFHNKRLEKIKEPSTVIKKDGNQTFDRLLVIMSNVLRNSEGVEDLELKHKAYRALIKYAMVYSILHRESIIDFVLKKKRIPLIVPSEVNLLNYLTDVPLYVQLAMQRHLGTPKLNSIISEKIKEDLKSRSTVSDIEVFFSVALYSDMKGKDFDKVMKKMIKSLKNKSSNYIVADYTFHKLIEYYYRRTRTGSPNEEMYLDLLAELKIRSEKLPKAMKSRIIKTYMDAKEKFRKSMTLIDEI